jgi:hypothetical protein
VSTGLAGTEVGRTFIDDYNATTGSAHYGAAHASRVPLFVGFPGVLRTHHAGADWRNVGGSRSGARLNLALSEPLTLSFQRPENGADLLQVAVEGINEVIAYQPVMDELPTALTRDQAGILQDRQMLGDGWFRDVEAFGDLPGRQIGLR